MEKRQFRILYRQFLFRMVDLEVLSSHAQGDISKLLGQFGALLIFLSLVSSLPAIFGYITNLQPEEQVLYAWGSEHFLIATTMLVVGLFAVLSWESTFPNRRDAMVLAPPPVRAKTLFLAKVAGVACAMGLVIAAVNLISGLRWPFSLWLGNPAVTMPALTYDAPMPPVKAVDLQAVLDRDLGPAYAAGSGPLAPGLGTGVAIGVWQAGARRVFTYGTAKTASMYEIGSISKTFTGLILARMIAEGKISLDKPVREMLPPDLVKKPRGPEMTLLDLATHHADLPKMPDNVSLKLDNPFLNYHREQLYEYMERRGVSMYSRQISGTAISGLRC